MQIDANPWNSFLETGKIDDYLVYCRNRKQEMLSSIQKGAATPDAADNEWNYPGRLEERG